MLELIFLKVINMSWGAGIVILIVCLARFLLKRFPKYISYMLWSVVLFRLFCPMILEINISPVRSIEPILYEYTVEEERVLPEILVEYSEPHIDTETVVDSEDGQSAYEPVVLEENSKEEKLSWQEWAILVGQYVWILGMSVMFLRFGISFVKMRKKVSTAIPVKDNIYITDETLSPFVMGILKPRIYLSGELSEKEQEYIILHEQFHIKHCDHIIKVIAYVALCIHWFNPLVWLSYVLFCKDMEMSCDEAVIKKMGEGIRADYSASLLALSTRHHIIGIPVDFGEGDTKGRIKNLARFRKIKPAVIVVLVIGVVILIVFLAFNNKSSNSDVNGLNDEGSTVEKQEESNKVNENELLKLDINIEDFYLKKTGDPANFYYIDEENVLWGSGRNEYGQLCQGMQDSEFHEEAVKMAENIVHVTFSQKGFVIYLTDDNKLYGVGNAGCGALQQYAEFDWNKYVNVNAEHYSIATPVLLMEDVVYACCGKDDVVCLKKDGTVWTWGTVYVQGNYFTHNAYYIQKPKQILENAVLVTGGWFNHTALLQDGTVWTWGYNSSGNCGVANGSVVKEPTMVAKDVVMVWTDLAATLESQPDGTIRAGATQYNVDYDSITEFNGEYPYFLNNTVIKKKDGSYWICGENVGTEEKVVHGAEADYTVICTHEFQPYEVSTDK